MAAIALEMRRQQPALMGGERPASMANACFANAG